VHSKQILEILLESNPFFLIELNNIKIDYGGSEDKISSVMLINVKSFFFLILIQSIYLFTIKRFINLQFLLIFQLIMMTAKKR
jgi:hypothetical protein